MNKIDLTNNESIEDAQEQISGILELQATENAEDLQRHLTALRDGALHDADGSRQRMNIRSLYIRSRDLLAMLQFILVNTRAASDLEGINKLIEKQKA